MKVPYNMLALYILLATGHWICSKIWYWIWPIEPEVITEDERKRIAREEIARKNHRPLNSRRPRKQPPSSGRV